MAIASFCRLWSWSCQARLKVMTATWQFRGVPLRARIAAVCGGPHRMATDTPLTPEQMARAASFLFGASKEAERMGQTVIVLPLRTASALARALLGVLNGE